METNLMKKRKSRAFGKDVYLLGKDKCNKLHWLQQPEFECGWYWGLGYVRSFTNNLSPKDSRDIVSHQHFDGLFLEGSPLKAYSGAFKEFFPETVLTDNEIWMLLELMRSAYTAKKYAEMLYVGGSHFTRNPVSEIIKCKEEYDRINQEIIPALMGQVAQLLSPVE